MEAVTAITESGQHQTLFSLETVSRAIMEALGQEVSVRSLKRYIHDGDLTVSGFGRYNRPLLSVRDLERKWGPQVAMVVAMTAASYR